MNLCHPEQGRQNILYYSSNSNSISGPRKIYDFHESILLMFTGFLRALRASVVKLNRLPVPPSFRLNAGFLEAPLLLLEGKKMRHRSLRGGCGKSPEINQFNLPEWMARLAGRSAGETLRGAEEEMAVTAERQVLRESGVAVRAVFRPGKVARTMPESISSPPAKKNPVMSCRKKSQAKTAVSGGFR